MKRIAFRSPVLIPLLLLGGCYHYVRSTDAARAASFAMLRAANVGDERLERFVRRRTAVIVGGPAVVAAHTREATVAIDFDPDFRHRITYAHATAIERDGYVLTAAHCVTPEAGTSYLIYFDPRGPAAAMARVVALSLENDLAIVHVDAVVADVFEWIECAIEGKRGTPVASAGCADAAWMGRRMKYYADVCVGGCVTSVSRCEGNALRVCSDVPLRTGDSGGPLVCARDGKLLGINTGAIMSWTGSGEQIATSIRPDLAWVRRMIEQDRHTSRPAVTTLPTTKPADRRTRTLLFSLDGEAR